MLAIATAPFTDFALTATPQPLRTPRREKVSEKPNTFGAAQPAEAGRGGGLDVVF